MKIGGGGRVFEQKICGMKLGRLENLEFNFFHHRSNIAENCNNHCSRQLGGQYDYITFIRKMLHKI